MVIPLKHAIFLLWMPSFKNGHLKILNRAFFSGRTGGEATTLGGNWRRIFPGGDIWNFHCKLCRDFFSSFFDLPPNNSPKFFCLRRVKIMGGWWDDLLIVLRRKTPQLGIHFIKQNFCHKLGWREERNVLKTLLENINQKVFFCTFKNLSYKCVA